MLPTTFISFCASVEADFCFNLQIYGNVNDIGLTADHEIEYIEEDSPHKTHVVPMYRCKLGGIELNEPRRDNYNLVMDYIRTTIDNNNNWFIVRIDDPSTPTISLFHPVTLRPLVEELYKLPSADKNGFAISTANVTR